MTHWSFISSVVLLCPQLCFAQQPAKNSEAAMVGLRGPVHTVLTENFVYRDNPQGKLTDSTLVIYDPEGYLLEEYHYDPDGSQRFHTKYTRKGRQVFKTETTGAIPSEDRTFVQSFNAHGLVTETETYDGNGSLLSKTKNDVPSSGGGATVSTSQETNGDGVLSITETIDKSTAPAIGLSRQTKFTFQSRPLPCQF